MLLTLLHNPSIGGLPRHPGPADDMTPTPIYDRVKNKEKLLERNNRMRAVLLMASLP